MASVSCEVVNICRFCLCQDEDILIPLRKIIDETLTVENIEQCTAVQIPKEEQDFYAICETCCSILQIFVSFRSASVTNDVLFHELFTALFESSGKTPAGTECVDQKEKNITSLKIEIVLPDDTTNNGSRHPCRYDDNDFDKASVAFSVGGISSESPTNAANEELMLAAVKTDQLTKSDSVKIVKKRKTAINYDQDEDDFDEKDNLQSGNLSGKSKSKKLCGTCGVFVSDLVSHMRIHTKEKFLKCTHCPIKMACRANLFRHIQAVHAKKILKSCELCDKGFTSTNSYRSHMRSHHGIGKTYDCKMCAKSFNHLSNYKEHYNRLHHTRIDYKCRICGKLFKDRSGLRGHRKVHSSSKPFACNQCPKKFKSGYARNTHQITHSGVRFACTMCSKSYQYKSVLSTHYRKHHANANESTVTGGS